MGIAAVAVYSEATRGAQNTLNMATRPWFIGRLRPLTQSVTSYTEKIIDAGPPDGWRRYPPGLRLLSENAAFARRPEMKPVIMLIGPSPREHGNHGFQTGAKTPVKAYDIPLVPGNGIGHRILMPRPWPRACGWCAEESANLKSRWPSAQSEAKNAFANVSVFLEKYIGDSKHIEVQGAVDSHGNSCACLSGNGTIQCRHQKVVEEAPSPRVTPENANQIGEHAVNVARSCNYLGGGYGGVYF
ncbi:hypothetical protein FQR65_LT20797 [Abscondita terminalis]|nr:hypothetical protein FQR65_LT20797 [Abscondita terminalis]